MRDLQRQRLLAPLRGTLDVGPGLYMWGMRGETPASCSWRWDHLEQVLARRKGWNRSALGDRVAPMEMFILNLIRMRNQIAPRDRPSFNFTLLG